VGILCLSGLVVKMFKDYERQLEANPKVEPVYIRKD